MKYEVKITRYYSGEIEAESFEEAGEICKKMNDEELFSFLTDEFDRDCEITDEKGITIQPDFSSKGWITYIR